MAPCIALDRLYDRPESYKRREHAGENARPKEVAKYALQELEKAWNADIATHEKNALALVNNRAIRSRVFGLMNEIGMPEKRQRTIPAKRWGGRSKVVTERAGYLDDLDREVPDWDGFESAIAKHERMLIEYRAYVARAEKEEAQEETKREIERKRKEEARKGDLQLAAIIVRRNLRDETLGLSRAFDWHAVLEHLRRLDRRVDLAIAMLQTRGDWSEGFYRVRDALSRFVPETEEDRAIFLDGAECLGNDDGRVFRDTTWNYDKLFASVTDRQLVEDVTLALQHLDDHED